MLAIIACASLFAWSVVLDMSSPVQAATALATLIAIGLDKSESDEEER